MKFPEFMKCLIPPPSKPMWLHCQCGKVWLFVPKTTEKCPACGRKVGHDH